MTSFNVVLLLVTASSLAFTVFCLGLSLGIRWGSSRRGSAITTTNYQELPFDLEEEARIEQDLREKLDRLDDETPTAIPAESPFAKLRAAVHATPEMKIMTVIEAAVAKLNRLDPPPGQCEHGVADGDWCELCNAEYKRAAADPENVRT